MQQQFVNISEVGEALLAQVGAREAADFRVLLSTTDARDMLGCGMRRLTQLMDEGEVDSVLEGRSRRVVASSLYNLIRKRIAASHPAGQAPVKVHDGRALRKREITKTEGLKGGASRPRKALAPHEARGGPA
ncbi:MAG TPA: hypothetical protein VFE60_03340 [Roseiarcus sp.]|jgi:hypothetical protein|nr:hypothetical protein [Roseiarcus sp.]